MQDPSQVYDMFDWWIPRSSRCFYFQCEPSFRPFSLSDLVQMHLDQALVCTECSALLSHDDCSDNTPEQQSPDIYRFNSWWVKWYLLTVQPVQCFLEMWKISKIRYWEDRTNTRIILQNNKQIRYLLFTDGITHFAENKNTDYHLLPLADEFFKRQNSKYQNVTTSHIF